MNAWLSNYFDTPHLRSTDSGGGIGYVSSLNSQNKLFVGVYIDIRLNCDIFPPQPANVRPEVTNNFTMKFFKI